MRTKQATQTVLRPGGDTDALQVQSRSVSELPADVTSAETVLSPLGLVIAFLPFCSFRYAERSPKIETPLLLEFRSAFSIQNRERGFTFGVKRLGRGRGIGRAGPLSPSFASSSALLPPPNRESSPRRRGAKSLLHSSIGFDIRSTPPGLMEGAAGEETKATKAAAEPRSPQKVKLNDTREGAVPDSHHRIMDASASSAASPSRLLSTNRPSAIADHNAKPVALGAELVPYLPKLLRNELSVQAAAGPRQDYSLPRTSEYTGAVMMIDISGFTALGEKLSAALGPLEGNAELATQVNSVLTEMVTAVQRRGGDVIKFAGDALICLFDDKVGAGSANGKRGRGAESARDCSIELLLNLKVRTSCAGAVSFCAVKYLRLKRSGANVFVCTYTDSKRCACPSVTSLPPPPFRNSAKPSRMGLSSTVALLKAI